MKDDSSSRTHRLVIRAELIYRHGLQAPTSVKSFLYPFFSQITSFSPDHEDFKLRITDFSLPVLFANHQFQPRPRKLQAQNHRFFFTRSFRKTPVSAPTTRTSSSESQIFLYPFFSHNTDFSLYGDVPKFNPTRNFFACSLHIEPFPQGFPVTPNPAITEISLTVL